MKNFIVSNMVLDIAGWEAIHGCYSTIQYTDTNPDLVQELGVFGHLVYTTATVKKSYRPSKLDLLHIIYILILKYYDILHNSYLQGMVLTAFIYTWSGGIVVSTLVCRSLGQWFNSHSEH